MISNNFLTAVGSGVIVLVLLVVFVFLCVVIGKMTTKYMRKRGENAKERQATEESAKRLNMTAEQVQVLQKICDFLNEKTEESQHNPIS